MIQSSTLDGASAPSTVLLAPWGEVNSANGTFVVDEDSARSVIEAFAEHGTDIPIDYEHQSLGGAYASPTGQAPAAGWIRALRAVMPEEAGDGEAGLLAEVAWTKAACERLSAKEYRYLSPVVIVRKSDRRMVALHSVALTNKPAIVGMKPIVNRQKASEIVEDGQEPSEADACCAIASGTERTVEMLRMRLGLPADSDVEMVLETAEDRLATLTQEAAHRDASEKVAKAFKSGKLIAVQRDWATALALTDPAAFDTWAASAPQVVRLGQIEAPMKDHFGHKGRDVEAIIASARADFRSEPGLALVTSESAWVYQALREAGFEPESSTESQQTVTGSRTS